MYNTKDSINTAYNYIQDLRVKGKTYGGYPVYNVTKSDLESLMSLANKYGIPFQWLVNLINFETGRTFNPAIQNSIGATGLIQFLRSTAIGLGTTTDALRKMTFKQQLVYVDKYIYSMLKNKLKPDGKITDNFTQGDLFMTIFYPVAVGKPNFVFPDSVKRANAGISKPYDYVEKALRVSVFPLTLFPYTLDDVKKKFGEVTEFTKKNWIPITIAILGLAGLGFYLYKTKKFEKIGKLI
jgi:hypothetical protein